MLGLVVAAPAAGQETYDGRADLEPRVVEREDGEKRLLPGGTMMRLKVGPDNRGTGHVFMGYDELPPGAGIPRHRHEIDEEILIVHRGTMRFTLRGETAVAEAGDCLGVRWRPGSAWSGEGSTEWLPELVGQLRAAGVEEITDRLDKGFFAERVVRCLQPLEVSYLLKVPNHQRVRRELRPWRRSSRVAAYQRATSEEERW